MRKMFILLGVLVFLGIVPAVSGFSVSSVTTDPPGDPVPNGKVTVTADIPCREIGLYDQMVMTTDLVEPVWEARTVLKEKESVIISASANGRTLTIPGAAFNLERSVTGSVRIRLTGYIPDTPSPGQNMLHIRQLDADGIAYAYPSGYDLPMATPVPAAVTTAATKPPTPRPTVNDSSFADLIAAQPADPSFGELIGAEPKETSFGELAGAPSTPATTPAERAPAAVSASPVTQPQTQESPAAVIVTIGAVALLLCARRR